MTKASCASAPALLCSDLDRTLLPNGLQTESSSARQWFACLARYPGLQLVYVSGRSLALLLDAVREYQLPLPNFAITDVGSQLYQGVGEQFQPLSEWQQHIGEDWLGFDSNKLGRILGDFQQLRQQSPAQQQHYKLSYQLQPSSALAPELALLTRRLHTLPLRWQLVSSIDETADMALVDILPASAGKLAAINFLVARLSLAAEQVFFSGDSGNDLDVLASAYPAVLVKNATAAVVRQAKALSRASGHSDRLYLAQGMPEWQLNGHYSAGIVEGISYFFPGLKTWLATEMANDE